MAPEPDDGACQYCGSTNVVRIESENEVRIVCESRDCGCWYAFDKDTDHD